MTASQTGRQADRQIVGEVDGEGEGEGEGDGDGDGEGEGDGKGEGDGEGDGVGSDWIGWDGKGWMDGPRKPAGTSPAAGLPRSRPVLASGEARRRKS